MRILQKLADHAYIYSNNRARMFCEVTYVEAEGVDVLRIL